MLLSNKQALFFSLKCDKKKLYTSNCALPCPTFLTCAAAFWLVDEMERLEQELEERGAEIERLQEEKDVALKEIEHQEKLQQSLRQQSQEQQQRQEELEMELDTKSELVCFFLASLCPS